MVCMCIYTSKYQDSQVHATSMHQCVFLRVSICTLVFVGSVDREACSILFAQGLKKHVVLARERCDMSLLKATWPARIEPCHHNTTEHFNTLFNNRAV